MTWAAKKKRAGALMRNRPVITQLGRSPKEELAGLIALASLAHGVRLVAELGALLDEILLPLRVLLDEGLGAEQQPLVGHGLDVVRLDLERLVHGRETVVDDLHLVLVGQTEITRRLVPAVGRQAIVRFGILRFELDVLANVLDQLV